VVVGELVTEAMNRMPLCTIYGDGLQRWVVFAPPQGSEHLEARLNEATITSFLDYLIRIGKFYSIPDYASRQFPPNRTPYPIESITVTLYGETRTVRNYSVWLNNEFNTLLDVCTRLSSSPVTFLPRGAWVSAQSVPATSGLPINWQPTAGFSVAALAESGQPFWLSGDSLTVLWNTIQKNTNPIRWVENGKSYRIGMQVLGFSREAPAAPAITPTPPIFKPSPFPTIEPTRTSVSKPGIVTATALPGTTLIPVTPFPLDTPQGTDTTP
jgi:hypothetical protein